MFILLQRFPIVRSSKWNRYWAVEPVVVLFGRCRHRSIKGDDLVGTLVKMKRTMMFLHLVRLGKVDIKEEQITV